MGFSRKQVFVMLGLSIAMSVAAQVVREVGKEKERERQAALTRQADSRVRVAQAVVAAELPAAGPARALRTHVSTVAVADGPKRAGSPLCAYRAADQRRIGRVRSGRPGTDGATELVTVALDAPAADGATVVELAAPAEVIAAECE